ncbi:hypothetical protein K432DRAFT_379434 [Lepidopterella palustris CBS 459.81]|uniref:Uncharacterized protein n=1 Tax=Lepidopterella palustris CBS 459.81 TaxID=1314670 RepID=A0A8E2EGC3_9PEZI|nr:hypothetical protein K432DRAFT_379434 [Lepidopterella palustris CBS 459.81]
MLEVPCRIFSLLSCISDMLFHHASSLVLFNIVLILRREESFDPDLVRSDSPVISRESSTKVETSFWQEKNLSLISAA